VTDPDCDYCYATMSVCPKCGPFDYAPDDVIGGQRDAGYHVSGWGLSGHGMDHQDVANARGWCWRDTDAWLRCRYAP
jgi:hypothetical protein